MLSIIIPANNEEAYLPRCLDALEAQTLRATTCGGVEVIVAANGCTDATVTIAQAAVPRFSAKGWDLHVLDIAQGSKSGALNQADATARGDMRAYLDADVIPSPDLLAETVDALAVTAPRYASGRLRVAPARSRVTRHFARIWCELPFMRDGVPGAGYFAVNAAGRARWATFPDIISDDTYVRLLFTPAERVAVSASYSWPMVEGFARLVRVRRRQDAGVAEVARRYPHLMANEGKARLGATDVLRLALRMPVSVAIYAAVLAAVRFGPGRATGWSRGR